MSARTSRIAWLACSPAVIAITALVLRLAGVFAALQWKPWIVANMSLTGGEVVQVARSIVLGNGFGNPVPGVSTGPTAWLCPVYAYIVAGVSKLTGVHTLTSTVILVCLNCIFVALTVFPIYAIARRTFGVATAVAAGWLWVVLPTAWNIPMRFVWDSTLNALSLAAIFWATLAVLGQRRLRMWILYGTLWALGALINASILSLAPFFFAWLLRKLRREPLLQWQLVATAALAFVLGVAPWTVRNYLVFGKFIPIRSNFGLVLWMGNHEGGSGFDGTLSPFWNREQAALYQQMGEVAYMKEKKHEAMAYIASHPAATIKLGLHNAWTFWVNVTDPMANPWRGRQPASADLVPNAIVIAGALLGAWLMLRWRNPAAFLYSAVLIFFPIVHYLTRPALRFRFTIEPLLAVLAGYGAVYVFQYLRGKAAEPQTIPYELAGGPSQQETSAVVGAR